MSTAIIDYGAGNIFSVTAALDRLNEKWVVTDKASVIKSADRVIFPGVGEAKSAMKSLKERGLMEVIKGLKQPFLGICLGLQLMGRHSDEGDVICLGLFDETTKRFPKRPRVKVPHMGWNNLEITRDDPLFFGLEDESYFYFVHSYYMETGEDTIAWSEYDGVSFSAAIRRDNFYAVQFHPEKSGPDGMKILKNFLEVKL